MSRSAIQILYFISCMHAALFTLSREIRCASEDQNTVIAVSDSKSFDTFTLLNIVSLVACMAPRIIQTTVLTIQSVATGARVSARHRSATRAQPCVVYAYSSRDQYRTLRVGIASRSSQIQTIPALIGRARTTSSEMETGTSAPPFEVFHEPLRLSPPPCIKISHLIRHIPPVLSTCIARQAHRYRINCRMQLLEPATGKLVSLSQLSDGASATLVMWWCNHCPFVIHLKGALAHFSWTQFSTHLI